MDGLLLGVCDNNRILLHFPSFFSQHWQVPLSKRFRALKLWFVIRNYGVAGLQAHIRKVIKILIFVIVHAFSFIFCLELQGVALAKKFETMVLSDDRFEIPAQRHLGMVVFRLKGENEMTEKLLKKLNGTGEESRNHKSRFLKIKHVFR